MILFIGSVQNRQINSDKNQIRDCLLLLLLLLLSHFSRVRLCVTLWTAAHHPSTGFSRQEYCSGLPFLSPATLLNSLISSSKFLILSLGFSKYRIRRRQWHPTPVLLPGESQGQGSPVSCHLWGHTESDTTEVT